MNELNFIKGEPAPDGVHDTVEFQEWKNPVYWARRRAIHDAFEKLAPVVFAILLFLAFFAIGYIETNF